MDNWFDLLLYVFEWCRTTYYVPIVILGHEITFTILGLLLIPFYVFIGTHIIKHLFELGNE